MLGKIGGISASHIAINPCNSAALADQMGLITEARASLLRGEIPEEEIISLTVNEPQFSEGIDESALVPLQQALSTAFHSTGRYRVIDPLQRRRLLGEIKTSLEGTSDEKLQLEVGRPGPF